MNELKEKIKIEMCGTYDSTKHHIGGQTVSQKRIADCFEIELFADDYHYTIINDTKYAFQKNTVIVAVPNDIRNGKLHYKCRFLHMDIFDDELKKAFSNLPHSIHISNYNDYSTCFDRIFMFYVTKNSLLLLSEIYKLLAYLLHDSILTQNAKNADISNSINDINHACLFMEKNFYQDINLQSIAKEACLSPNYFHSVFSKIYGKTPRAYLTDVRIANAKLLLLNTNKNLTEISYLCGFNSQPYFNYCFHKRCGLTPSEFRNKSSKCYSEND